jgi:hypothetical protein
MPVNPALALPTVWQAIARPDDGSWNQATLAAPLAEVPMGT